MNKKIIKIRKNLDKLDDIFLSIIKRRTLLVNQILKNKKFKKDIVDQKRIRIILKNIHRKSKKKYRSANNKSYMEINDKAYIDYEYRNFKKK